VCAAVGFRVGLAPDELSSFVFILSRSSFIQPHTGKEKPGGAATYPHPTATASTATHTGRGRVHGGSKPACFARSATQQAG